MNFTEEEFLAAAENLHVQTDVFKPLEHSPDVYVLILHRRGFIAGTLWLRELNDNEYKPLGWTGPTAERFVQLVKNQRTLETAGGEDGNDPRETLPELQDGEEVELR
jgi:hypothetical protein